MSSNKVKLLNKEQLIIAIEQSGNENIAEILKDKNLDGQELLDLTELKIINWRLGSSQKKELFTFINNLEVNPSNMLGKHIPTNVSKSDTDTTKSIPIESKNHELIPNPHSSPSKFPFGNPPEIGISGKKANFVQELNSLLSGALSNPSNLSTSIPKVDNNPVASSNQILNIPRSTRDDETIISKYDQGTSSLSPILYPETSQFRQKDSMNALLPIAQPLQSGSKTPKPYRKPVFSRLGVAKSTGDLVNGWDQVGGPPPVPSKTKVVRKISDHGDKSSKGAGDIRDYSKKETGHFSPPIYNGIADAESSPGKNILKLPQNVLNVPQEVTRKPIPLPTRGIAQPLIQSMDQTVCAPISSSNQRLTKQPIEKKNSIEANSTGKHLKKKTRKFSLPILNPPKASFEPSLLQSPENVSSVSTEVNRKPIPLPTRGFAQPLPQDQAVCAPSPPSKKKIIKHAYDNKNIIEQDATGTNLESDEFRKKEEPPSSKFVDTNDEEESTTKYSIFYVPLEEKTSQETTFGVPYSIDDHGYLQLLQNPVDKTPVSTEKRNEFLLDLSKAVKEKVVQKTVKEKVVQKKVPQWIVQDHSHLSLIITPPSSDDELFDEDQEEEEYTHRSITINQSTTCNKFGLQLLLRPPTRMVTPEFVDEDGYFEINIQHGAKRFNIGNLSNDRYYMQIRGKETKRMLMSREDGSFLFRPSKKFFLVLTIKHGGKLYNFGIDLEADGKIYLDGKSGFALGGFSSLQEFVNYFCCEPITFKDENMMIEIYMNPFLGPDSFSCYNNQKTDHNTYQNIFFSTYTKK